MAFRRSIRRRGGGWGILTRLIPLGLRVGARVSASGAKAAKGVVKVGARTLRSGKKKIATEIFEELVNSFNPTSIRTVTDAIDLAIQAQKDIAELKKLRNIQSENVEKSKRKPKKKPKKKARRKRNFIFFRKPLTRSEIRRNNIRRMLAAERTIARLRSYV